MSCPVHLPYALMMDTMEKACSPGMAVKGCHCSGEMPLLLTYTSCGTQRDLTLWSPPQRQEGTNVIDHDEHCSAIQRRCLVGAQGHLLGDKASSDQVRSSGIKCD